MIPLKLLFLLHFFIFIAMNCSTAAAGTDLKQTTDFDEADQKRRKSDEEEEKPSPSTSTELVVEIDAEPRGGFFDLLNADELPFPTRTFSINFLNHQLDYAVLIGSTKGLEECPPGVELFVFVPSRPDAFYTRLMIRDSWAANLTDTIALKFVVGWPLESDSSTFDTLLVELAQFGDLIFYDIEDTYGNLYLKVYVALQWQQAFCPDAKFLLKTDDDTVVELGRLQWWILNEFGPRAAEHPAAVFGGVWRGVRPIRAAKHKWFVSRQSYPKSSYPPYMNGPTYLLTGQAAQAILNETREVNAFSIEDILYTGILAGRGQVRKFSVWQHFRPGKFIFTHEHCRVDKSTGRRVPFVTAIYGVKQPDKLAKALEQLRAIDCSPWSSRRRTQWSSYFEEAELALMRN